MIHSLELEKYRGFQRYKLSDLSRVNLLVGKNNSGKTSILEAVQILAARGEISELARIAGQRGD
jgi:recombinational DNA repair ATPase RecF